MRTIPTLLPTLLLMTASTAACVSGTPGGSSGDDEVVADGGRFTPVGCSGEILTVVGAEAPALGADVLGDAPDPFQVHLGLGEDPRTSIAVVWRTDEATTSTQVRFGEGAALDETAAGVTYRYIAGIAGTGDLIRMHEARLCGLSPDTEYSYQVGGTDGAGVESFSATHTFRTAPDVGSDPDAEVTIAMVGDSRGGPDIWAQLATDIAANAPDLIMYSGDAVTLGQIQDEWDDFFEGATELIANVPMISAHGNHEVNSVNYYSLFAMPGDESSYSFDYGHAHMTVLNDSPPQNGDIEGSIKTFLENDLDAATARWTILNHHRPLWSSGTRHGSDDSLRAAWGAAIDEKHVDLVVAGHDHIYERTAPMLGDQVQASPADGTVYLVTGGAGAELYGVEMDFFTAIAESRHSMVIVQIRQDSLTLRSFEPGATVPFDELTITKP